MSTGAISHDTVVDAFYEITLKYKRLNARRIRICWIDPRLHAIRNIHRWGYGHHVNRGWNGAGKRCGIRIREAKSVIERKLNRKSVKNTRGLIPEAAVRAVLPHAGTTLKEQYRRAAGRDARGFLKFQTLVQADLAVGLVHGGYRSGHNEAVLKICEHSGRKNLEKALQHLTFSALRQQHKSTFLKQLNI